MASRTHPAHHVRPALAGRDARLRFAIAGGPRAPERARTWLTSRVSWLGEDARKQMLLLACELVNNAVRHGGAGEDQLIGLSLWPTGSGVGIEVTDHGPGFTPASRRHELEDPGGWGLVLVESLSERWGVVRDERTRVWFELSAAARA